MEEYCLYVHTNKINNKVYIGITNNIERRWRNKGIEYKPKKENTRPFWNAICKYGWDNFEHEVIQDNLMFEEACELEKYYIKLSQSTNRIYGYNIAIGGNGGRIYENHPKGMKGKHHTDEWKKEHSERMKGENNPFYGKTWTSENHPKGFKNKTHKEHPKGMKGKHHTEESKRKTSETIKNMTTKCCTKVLVVMPNGEQHIFNKAREAIEFTGITTRIYYKLLKSGEPYKLSKMTITNTEFLKNIEGLTIIKID